MKDVRQHRVTRQRDRAQPLRENHMEILANRVRLPRRFVRSVIMCVLLMIPLTASAQEVEEYEVKAAFLYNFTRFVEWPSVSGSPAFAVFTICILGDDPFGSTLDQLVKGKTAYSRPIQVRRLKDAVEARQCQIVFVKRGEDAKAPKLVEVVKGMPVLTVGERHGFGRLGGMIYLSVKDHHVGVVVNTWIAEKNGLRISAKLMSVAKKFNQNEDDEN